jgi:hypothetical protein
MGTVGLTQVLQKALSELREDVVTEDSSVASGHFCAIGPAVAEQYRMYKQYPDN